MHKYSWNNILETGARDIYGVYINRGKLSLLPLQAYKLHMHAYLYHTYMGVEYRKYEHIIHYLLVTNLLILYYLVH